MINSHCHMIFHCRTCKESSIARAPPLVFFVLLPKAYHTIVLECVKHHPSTYSMFVWEYILLGGSKIYLLCSMIFPCQSCVEKSSMSMARTFPRLDFSCSCLSQGLPLFWKTSNIIPKHLCSCGNKFYWVVQWFTCFVPLFFTARHII